jgi:hypothetical protein
VPTVPAGDWSVKFQRFKGPGSEATPYQIVSIKPKPATVICTSADLQLDVPRDRLFFIHRIFCVRVSAGSTDQAGCPGRGVSYR